MKFEGLNWRSLESQIGGYGKNPPFDHVVIDDFFTEDFAKKLSSEFPAYEDEIWHGYDNPIEVKKFAITGTYFRKTHTQLSLILTPKNGFVI